MSGIAWLASYPKSGNTWCRAFLTSYLDGEARLNGLIGAPIAGQRSLIDEWVGFPTFGLGRAREESLRADAYRALAAACRERGRPTFVKVHDYWRQTPRGEPLFPWDATFRVVYLIRDPKDVAVSFAHHLGKSPKETVVHMAREDFALAVNGPHTVNQVMQVMGSWSLNVESWIDTSEMYVHVMRYEDTKRDPAKAYRAMLTYLGIEIDEVRFGHALADSSLEAMQAREKAAGGFREAAKTADSPFFRKGQVGSHREELLPEDRARLEATHGRLMKRFGYL